MKRIAIMRGWGARLWLVGGLMLVIGNVSGVEPAADPPSTISANTYSVLAYGGDPTGQQDSAPALDKIMRAVGSQRQIHILIPAGRYRLARRVCLQASGNDSAYGLHIEGAGENVTEILVDNAEGGLAFMGTRISRLCVTISGLSLVAGRDGAGTALFFDTANAGVQNERQFTARDLTLRGERFDRGHFRTGVHVRNAWHLLLHNIKVMQQYPPVIREQAFNMEYNFLLEDCYSPSVTDCRTSFGRFGLVHRAVNMAPDAPEDGIIRGSYFVGQAEGIIIDLKKGANQWPEPGFHIDNCHVAYRDNGIRINGVQQANISHCLFYCLDRTGNPWHQPDLLPVPGGDKNRARDFTPCDINIEHGSNLIVDGNIFTEPSTPNRIGVRIGPLAGHVLVSGNQFNMSGVAIQNESCAPSYASGNMYGGKPDWSSGLTRYRDAPQTLRRTHDFQ